MGTWVLKKRVIEKNWVFGFKKGGVTEKDFGYLDLKERGL